MFGEISFEIDLSSCSDKGTNKCHSHLESVSVIAILACLEEPRPPCKANQTRNMSWQALRIWCPKSSERNHLSNRVAHLDAIQISSPTRDHEGCFARGILGFWICASLQTKNKAKPLPPTPHGILEQSIQDASDAISFCGITEALW